MPISKNLFLGVNNGLRMVVSDLNQLVGRVKRSDLVQSGRDTSSDVVGGLTRAREQYITVISFGAHLGLWRPLEAKPNTQW